MSPESLPLVRAASFASATFAGNLILIGSMANLIVAERAAARGVRLGFIEYARVGVPLALLSTLWSALVLSR